jgi:cyclin A
MSRRQALGTLNQNGSEIIFQASSSTTTSTTTTTDLAGLNKQSINVFSKQLDCHVNNENKPPTATTTTESASSKTDFDFFIFKEEFNEFNKQKEAVSEQVAVKLVSVNELKNVESDDSDEDDGDYEEEEETEEEEVEEEEEDDDEVEDENENKEDADFRHQFQDISSKVLLSESDIENEKTDIMNVNMCDDSSSLNSSPMILESNEYQEDEYDSLEKYEETDEASRRRLDAQEREDCLKNCMEYKDDILGYMRQLEKTLKPQANYMKKQSDITSSMRSILVDWLVEVSEEYRLQPETLFLAVSYTDRFLSQMSVLRGKLQLVGTASMYIASKYEEISPPDVSEYVFITDDTYTKKQVLRMEHLLLKVLDFKISPPTISWFLMHFLRFIKIGTSLNLDANKALYTRIELLSRYLCELTLIDGDTYLAYLPSQIAASALWLAFYTLGRPWTSKIAEIIGYNPDLGQLKACIGDLYQTMMKAPEHPQQAVQEKYNHSKYEFASIIEPPKSLPAHLLQ